MATIFVGRDGVIHAARRCRIDQGLTNRTIEADTYRRKDARNGISQGWMSVRSACKWQSGPLPSETKQERWWRTRPDPFDGVWTEGGGIHG